MGLPSRDEALLLLREHTQNENLVKHMLAVEAAMRHYARKGGADEDLWGLTGLLHDLDYERHPTPQEHPRVGVGILREKGYPEEMLHAIEGHADYLGVPRDTPLARTLFAVDEICGFVVAVALVRPSKKIADVEVSSVKKKLKDKAFARGVNREDVEKGLAELGLPADLHIANVVEALKGAAGELGL